MCIIVVKPKGVKSPKTETLVRCFTENLDGAGFAINKKDSNEIILMKGFQEFGNFYDAYLRYEVNEDDEAILHFRTASSGGYDETNCHPFPIISQVKLLKAKKLTTKMTVVAHNGTIWKCEDKSEKELSDTMMFIRDILSDKAVVSKIYESECIKKLVEEYIGISRLAFLDAKKGILTIGDFEEFEGCLFSNKDYKEKTYTTTTTPTTKEEEKKEEELKDKTKNDDPYDCEWCGKTCRKTYCIGSFGWVCESCYDVLDDKLEDTYVNYCPYCYTYNRFKAKFGEKRNIQCGKCLAFIMVYSNKHSRLCDYDNDKVSSVEGIACDNKIIKLPVN